MEAIANRRTSHRVNYSESSDDDELGSSIARDVVQEVVDNFQELNKKKQFKKIYQFSENREDWEIVENKRVSKGNDPQDCYSFYLRFQPGVYRILIKDILKILQTEFDLKLKTGKPERFGNATIKSICNFQMKVGDKEKTLQLCFYHTNHALDVKVIGNPRTSSEKFLEFCLKNGAFYFVLQKFCKRFTEIMMLMHLRNIGLTWLKVDMLRRFRRKKIAKLRQSCDSFCVHKL